MTIIELIEELKKYDPNKIVTINGEEIQFISDYIHYATKTEMIDIISDEMDEEDFKPTKPKVIIDPIVAINEKLTNLFT